MAKLNVPVTKSKGTVEIDTDNIPEDFFREALLQGLKVLVNRGMSKITKETYTNAEELKAAAQAKAEDNAKAVLEGDRKKIKLTGQSGATKVSGAEKTEAMRLARNLVKDEMKRVGIKISHVPASEITAAAKQLLDSDEAILEQAKKNLAERDAVKVSDKIDLRAIMKEDPTLVAKAEAKKAAAKKDGGLSAKQAGMTKTRAKPQAQQSTAQH